MLCTVWGVISCLHETFVVLLSFCMHCVLKDMGIANLPLVDVFLKRASNKEPKRMSYSFSGLYKVISTCFCEKEITHFLLDLTTHSEIQILFFLHPFCGDKTGLTARFCVGRAESVYVAGIHASSQSNV